MEEEEKKVVVTAFIAALVEGVRLLAQHGADEESLYASVSAMMDRRSFDMIIGELIKQKTFKRRGLSNLVYCGPCMLIEGSDGE